MKHCVGTTLLCNGLMTMALRFHVNYYTVTFILWYTHICIYHVRYCTLFSFFNRVVRVGSIIYITVIVGSVIYIIPMFVLMQYTDHIVKFTRHFFFFLVYLIFYFSSIRRELIFALYKHCCFSQIVRIRHSVRNSGKISVL